MKQKNNNKLHSTCHYSADWQITMHNNADSVWSFLTDEVRK